MSVQTTLKQLRDELGSWQKVADHYGNEISRATLWRYAHGAPVRMRAHRQVLGLCVSRPRLSINKENPVSAVDSMTEHIEPDILVQIIEMLRMWQDAEVR